MYRLDHVTLMPFAVFREFRPQCNELDGHTGMIEQKHWDLGYNLPTPGNVNWSLNDGPGSRQQLAAQWISTQLKRINKPKNRENICALTAFRYFNKNVSIRPSVARNVGFINALMGEALQGTTKYWNWSYKAAYFMCLVYYCCNYLEYFADFRTFRTLNNWCQHYFSRF